MVFNFYKYLITLIFIIFFKFNINTLNYITTAESISWYGANTSVSDGLEAMLYNPAGIYLAPARFGLNMLGTYGVRYYNNTFTTAKLIDLYKLSISGKNLTKYGWISDMISYMPDTGYEIGFNYSIGNIMTFIRFTNFSLGLSLQQKFNTSMVMDKNIFRTIFQKLDLTKENYYDIKFYALNYIDFN
ncbi:MAG: hypothetical protein JXB50_15145, partial [Spirochaetes bacterium]|nr:hypothetical protein [Spirochaetota bacterium]